MKQSGSACLVRKAMQNAVGDSLQRSAVTGLMKGKVMTGNISHVQSSAVVL